VVQLTAHMKNKRPKVTLTAEPLDKFLDTATLFALVFVWGYTVYQYGNLPEQIPSHFNSNGEIDGYGRKSSLFLIPFLLTIIYVLLSVLNRFPEIFNYPVKITRQNADKHYRLACRMMRWLLFTIAGMFSYMTIVIVQSALHQTSMMQDWMLPLIILLLILPPAIYLFKAYKEEKVNFEKVGNRN
jgi:uncharacterized membrane protein